MLHEHGHDFAQEQPLLGSDATYLAVKWLKLPYPSPEGL